LIVAMRMAVNKRRDSGGFTIAEISIATAIFAVILLIAMAIFFGIGRIFYKGISVSQTQEATEQVYQDIAGNFQGASSVSIPTGQPNGYYYYCIGNTRYTYNPNYEVDLNNPSPSHAAPGSGGTFGILKDSLPGGCATPCDDINPLTICSPPNVKFNNPVELLGQKMRVSQFSITPSANNPNLYKLDLVIAFGDDDVLDTTDPANPVCKTGVGSEFCSVNRIDTAIYQGLNF